MCETTSLLLLLQKMNSNLDKIRKIDKNVFDNLIEYHFWIDDFWFTIKENIRLATKELSVACFSKSKIYKSFYDDSFDSQTNNLYFIFKTELDEKWNKLPCPLDSLNYSVENLTEAQKISYIIKNLLGKENLNHYVSNGSDTLTVWDQDRTFFFSFFKNKSKIERTSLMIDFIKQQGKNIKIKNLDQESSELAISLITKLSDLSESREKHSDHVDLFLKT